MCQANGKLIADWMRTNEYIRYTERLSESMGIPIDRLVTSNPGQPSRGGGTWIHPKLAIKLARWISVDFELWCDEHIETLMKTGTTALAEPQKTLSVAEMKAIVKQKEEQRLRVLEASVNGNDYFIGLRGKVKQLQSEFEQLNNFKAESLGYMGSIDNWIGFFKKEIEKLKTEVAQLKESASIHDTPAMAMTRLKHAQQMELLERQHELRRIERAEKAQEVINAREEKKQFEADTKYAKTIEKLMILAEKHQALSARIVNQSGLLKHLKADQVRDIFKLMSEQGLGTLNGEGNRLKFSLNPQDNSQN
jgi:hypothetical protein